MVRLSGRGVAAGLFVLVLAAVCVRLGFWQLHRLDERRARNEALSEALALPTLELDGDALARVLSDPGGYRYRRVRASGEFSPEGAFLLRGRAHRGTPGVHLVEPLRLGGDTVLLVDRGWLPAGDGASVDPRPYHHRGWGTVEGLLQPLPSTATDAQAVTLEVDGVAVRTYQRLDLDTLRTASIGSVLPIYLLRIPAEGESDSLPIPEPIPTLDEGPHLGYAMQWFSFAAIAVIGFGVVVFRSGRESRS